MLWHYAETFQHHMHSDPKHKLPQSAFRDIQDLPGALTILSSPRIMAMMIDDNFGRIGHLHLSNIGNCSHHPRDYGDGDVFRLIEWHVTSSSRIVGYTFSLFTATFHGTMFFDLQYTEPLVSREQADAVADEAMNLIAQVTPNADGA